MGITARLLAELEKEYPRPHRKREEKKSLVGDMLAAIIHERHGHNPCVGCQHTLTRMNQLGVAGCLKEIESLVDEMQANARNLDWLTWLKANAASLAGSERDIYSALIREACDRVTSENCPTVTLADPRWAVGITTAPRKTPTLARTVKSLYTAGWVNPLIFAEPTSPEMNDLPPGCAVFRNDVRLGGFANWLKCLAGLVAQSDCNMLLILQDDIELQTGARWHVESHWPTGGGVVSLYCSSAYHQAEPPLFLSPSSFYGILAVAMTRETAESILADPWLLSRTHRPLFDAIIGQWAERQSVPLWIHTPTLGQHIGDTSVMHPGAQNAGRRKARAARGEHDKSGQPGSVTVVLSLFQRPHTFDRQLQWIEQQEYPIDSIWVTLPGHADGFVPDRLKRAARRGTDRVFIAEPDPGYHFRFACAMQAQTEFVFVLDDDTIPGRLWLRNCVDSFRKEPGIYGALGSIERSLEKYSDRTRFGYENPLNESTEVDWVGWNYFLRPEWIAYMFAAPMVHSSNADDLHLCLRAKRLGGIKSYVPPHPNHDRDMWGSLDPRQFGADEIASWRRSDFKQQRVEVMISERARGWVPLEAK